MEGSGNRVGHKQGAGPSKGNKQGRGESRFRKKSRIHRKETQWGNDRGREGRTRRGGFRQKQRRQVCPADKSITPRKPTYTRAHPNLPGKQLRALRHAWTWAQGGRWPNAAHPYSRTCVSVNPRARGSLYILGVTARVCARKSVSVRARECVCMHARRTRALRPAPGDGGARGGRHSPERGASGQSLRLWIGFNNSSFRGRSRSSCFWRHPGANSDA